MSDNKSATPRRYYVYLSLPVFLIFGLFVTMSGFCYSEMRYIAPREVFDRALTLKAIPTNSLPENCKITSKPFDATSGDIVFSALIFNQGYRALECVHPPQPDEKSQNTSNNFHFKFISTNSCVTKIIDTSGSRDLSEESYNAYLKKNRAFWDKAR